MRFHILTLFPEMVEQGLHTSILERAQKKGLIEIDAVNIRTFTDNPHGKVDDYTYGGGAGLLMQAQPVYDACMSVQKRLEKPARVIFMSPAGEVFTQKKAEELSCEEDLILLCGHYEGIDERILEEIHAERISIGDYVLTGGELPAMIVTDCVARLIPGVLGNEESSRTESFQDGLLEYPQYTRPEEWHGRRVPDVLLSGDHQKVSDWRLGESLKVTKKTRPDLYRAFVREMKQKLYAPKGECPYTPSVKKKLLCILEEAEKD